jgi:hypothetical protein
LQNFYGEVVREDLVVEELLGGVLACYGSWEAVKMAEKNKSGNFFLHI